MSLCASSSSNLVFFAMCGAHTCGSLPAFTWDGAHSQLPPHNTQLCAVVSVMCMHTVRVQWVDPTEHGSSGSCVGMEGTRKFILKTLEVSYKKKAWAGLY